jgi:hypothetical protein
MSKQENSQPNEQHIRTGSLLPSSAINSLSALKLSASTNFAFSRQNFSVCTIPHLAQQYHGHGHPCEQENEVSTVRCQTTADNLTDEQFASILT